MVSRNSRTDNWAARWEKQVGEMMSRGPAALMALEIVGSEICGAFLGKEQIFEASSPESKKQGYFLNNITLHKTN